MAASAPHSSDLCVCCWHSTLGPLVNFSRGCSGTELSLEYLLSPQNVLKGKSAAQLNSHGFFFFLPLLFLRQCRHCDVPEMPFRSHATITAVASASSLMFHTLISPLPAPVLTHPLSPFSLSLKKKKKFEHFLSHADVWCWCGKHPLHST